MIVAGHGHVSTALPNDSGDFLGVGRDDHAIGGTGLDDALPHTNNERSATEETKRFAGEPRCAEPGGYDRERAQANSIGCVRRCKRHAIQGIPLMVEIQAELGVTFAPQTALWAYCATSDTAR